MLQYNIGDEDGINVMNGTAGCVLWWEWVVEARCSVLSVVKQTEQLQEYEYSSRVAVQPHSSSRE